MKQCSVCARHVQLEETACPFCRTPLSTIRAPLWFSILGATALAAGCAERALDETDGTGDGTSDNSDSDSATVTSSGAPGIDASTTTDTGDSTTCAETSGGFIYADPCPGRSVQCDVWKQDCPDGEKCMPWAFSGGTTWDGVKCSPLDPNPQQVGETCTVEDSPVSGVDNCDVGAMCWNVDDEGVGTCVGFCSGSLYDPVCGPGTACVIANDGILILCLASCNPLVQDCDQGEGCHSVAEEFVCVPLADETAEYGDMCEHANSCAVGLTCFEGQCTPWCDLQSPDTCPDPQLGVECIAWFRDPPDGFESLGVCTIPP